MNKIKPLFSTKKTLTRAELAEIAPSDLVNMKLNDDEKALVREINKERLQSRVERSAKLRIEEKPILAELKKVDCIVNSVWDIANVNNSNCVSILINHLFRPYSDRTKEGIARALSQQKLDSSLTKAWPDILAEYRKAPSGFGIVAPNDTSHLRLGAKDALAGLLAVIVTDETLRELIELLKDSSNGESRVLFLSALKRSKSTLAKEVLKELVNDPELNKEISSWE